MNKKTKELIDALQQATKIVDIKDLIHQLELASYAESLPCLTWGISSNIVLHSIDLVIKKHTLLNGFNAKVINGIYNAHMANIENFKSEKVDYAIFCNFFDALIPYLESRVSLLNLEFMEQIKNNFISEIKIILKESNNFKFIFIPLLHLKNSIPITSNSPTESQKLLSELNDMLRSEVAKYCNVILLDSNEIISQSGREATINNRFYLNYKSPYTIIFYEEFIKQIFLCTRANKNYFYKALVLDCDNTLWGGIVAEDGLDELVLNPYEYPGNIY